MMSPSLKKVIQQRLLKLKAHIPFKPAILPLGTYLLEAKAPVYIREELAKKKKEQKNDTKN